MNSIIDELIRLGHSVKVIAAYSDVNEDHSKIKPSIVSLSSKLRRKSRIPFINPLKVSKILKSSNSELILFRADRNFFTIFASLALLKYRNNIIIYDQYTLANHNFWLRLFFCFRDSILKPKVVITPVFDKITLEAELIQTLNETVEEFESRIFLQLGDSFNGRNWVPFSIDNKVDEDSKGWKDRTIDILISSKLEKRKNLIETLNQLSILNVPEYVTLNVTLAVVCRQTDSDKTKLEYLKSVIHNMGRNLKIELLVNTPSNKMSSLYLNTKIFILLSDNEPASYSNIQAAASGCIVVLSKSNGTASNHAYNNAVTIFTNLKMVNQHLPDIFTFAPLDLSILESFNQKFKEIYDSKVIVSRIFQLLD